MSESKENRSSYLNVKMKKMKRIEIMKMKGLNDVKQKMKSDEMSGELGDCLEVQSEEYIWRW